MILRREQPSWRKFDIWLRVVAYVLAGLIIARVGRAVSDFYLSLLAVLCVGAVLGVVIGFTRGQLAIPRLRPYLRQFIEEHRDEISRAA